MLVVVGGYFGEKLEEEFLDFLILNVAIDCLSDEFGHFGTVGCEVFGIIDWQVYEFFGAVDGIWVVRIEYFLY